METMIDGGKTGELGWLSVSPSKLGRSGGKDHVNQNIGSPSRFAILATEEGQADTSEGNDSNIIEKVIEEGEIPDIET
ncbi:hypothetical protein F2Q68_00026185 [Brassica cretica]|uniref:Uncharacterized protein n=1 Tax=Brassica cretica TaxID=69181 RepID=A0A8S9I9U6_BRACR|nr:hypothetical protein F2Q68_00026185 [Brassica cretica]